MSVKTTGSYHTPNRLYVRKNDKNQIFENRVSRSGWAGLKKYLSKPYFLTKLLLQSLPEIVLRILRPCSRYLEGAPNLVLYAGKKSGSYGTPIKTCARKSDKNPIFENWVSNLGCGALRNFCPNPVVWGKTFASKPPRNCSTYLTTMFKVFRRCTKLGSLRW